MTLSGAELALIDRWQRNFPLVSRPFALVGQSVGLDEPTTIAAFERLRHQRVLSRIGAVVKPHTIGASTLAAMRVPPERLDEVAAIVSREPMVSHNYERTNEHNLWFVVAGPHQQAVAGTIESIEVQSGLEVLDLPLLRAYHLDLGFPLSGERARSVSGAQSSDDYQPDAIDRRLLAAIEDGLPLVLRPYRSVATAVGCDESAVLASLQRLMAAGVVARFGCVIHHRALGYIANAMAVWDIPDEQVDDIAHVLVRNPRVTLCYRRRRRPPDWPFNLYCMVHAKSRPAALATVGELNAAAGIAGHAQTVLFSPRCFKQRGAVFSDRKSRPH
jgi:DNA-binding Lrp family transcriptional regulator